MNASIPSSLDSTALARRLGELAGEEREVQVDFLLHLAEFDQRRAYLEAGFGSLWEYCLKALHLREGAAGRRIAAMRVLRQFPKLQPTLRDGRLCLSTLSLLGQVLTEENAEDLLARAAYKTKAEVEHLVATIRPREAPRDGIRKLPESHRSGGGMALALRSAEPAGSAGTEGSPALAGPNALPKAPEPVVAFSCAEAHRPRTEKPRPVSESEWSLRLTLDADCKKDLETLTELLSHKIPGGDLRAVLREAIRCGIEKHGNRKGAKAPAQKREPKAKPNASGKYIPAAVRRAVWERDGGCCSWTGPDGRRCGSRWQLELDHIHPVALGGASTLDGLRLICRAHNMLYAEQVYGREHMDRFRRAEGTISRNSGPPGIRCSSGPAARSIVGQS